MHVFVNFKASKGFTMSTLEKAKRKFDNHLKSMKLDDKGLKKVWDLYPIAKQHPLEWYKICSKKNQTAAIANVVVNDLCYNPNSKLIDDTMSVLESANSVEAAIDIDKQAGRAAAGAQENADKAAKSAAKLRANFRRDARAYSAYIKKIKHLKKQTVQKLQPVKKFAQRLIEIFNFLSKSLRPHFKAAAAEDCKVKSTHEKYLEKIGKACNDLQNVIQKCENPSKGNSEVFTPKELAGEIQGVVNAVYNVLGDLNKRGSEFHALFISESTKTKLALGELKELASKCTTKVQGMNTGKAKTALSAQIAHANILLKDLERICASVPAPATSRIISKLSQASLNLKKIRRDCLTASDIINVGRHIAVRNVAYRLIDRIQSKIGEIDREEEHAREKQESERVAKERLHLQYRFAAAYYANGIIAASIDKVTRRPRKNLGSGGGYQPGITGQFAPVEARISNGPPCTVPPKDPQSVDGRTSPGVPLRRPVEPGATQTQQSRQADAQCNQRQDPETETSTCCCSIYHILLSLCGGTDRSSDRNSFLQNS